MINREELLDLLCDCDAYMHESGQRDRLMALGYPLYKYSVGLSDTNWSDLYYINSVEVDFENSPKIVLHVDIEFFEVGNFYDLDTGCGHYVSISDTVIKNKKHETTVNTQIQYIIESTTHGTYGKVYAYPLQYGTDQLTVSTLIQNGTHYFNYTTNKRGYTTVTAAGEWANFRDCKVIVDALQLGVQEYKELVDNGISIIAKEKFIMVIEDCTDENREALLSLFDHTDVLYDNNVILRIINSDGIPVLSDWLGTCVKQLAGKRILHKIRLEECYYTECQDGRYWFCINGNYHNYDRSEIKYLDVYKKLLPYFELVECSDF